MDSTNFLFINVALDLEVRNKMYSAEKSWDLKLTVGDGTGAILLIRYLQHLKMRPGIPRII